MSYFTGEFEFKTGKRGFVGRPLMISDCLSHCDVEKLSFSSVFFFFDRLFTVPYFPLRSSRTNMDKCYVVVSIHTGSEEYCLVLSSLLQLQSELPGRAQCS